MASDNDTTAVHLTLVEVDLLRKALWELYSRTTNDDDFKRRIGRLDVKINKARAVLD